MAEVSWLMYASSFPRMRAACEVCVSTSYTIWLSIVEPAVTVVCLPTGPCSGDTVGLVTSQPYSGWMRK